MGVNKTLENGEASMAEKFKANFGNHGSNKKRHTTAWMRRTMSLEMNMS